MISTTKLLMSLGLGKLGCVFFLGSRLLFDPVYLTVVPVLDAIVTSTLEILGYLGPALAILANSVHDILAFLWSDARVVEPWLQVLVVSFATLLGTAILHAVGDAGPVDILVWCTADVAQEPLVL